MSGASAFSQALAAWNHHKEGRSARGARSLAPLLQRPDLGGWPHLLRYLIRKEAGLPGAARDLDTAFRRDPRCAWILGLVEAPEDAEARRLAGELAGRAERREAGGVKAYMGQAALMRGDRAGGLRLLERAAEQGGEGWIWGWLGEAQRQAGQTEKALESFSWAIALGPRDDNARAWRASTLLQLGRAAEAKADLDRAIALRATPRALLDRFRARRMLGDLDGAFADLERAVRLQPELGWGGPKPEGARRAYEEIGAELEKHPGDARLLAWRGETRLRLGRLKEALADLDAALKKHPGLAWAKLWRAEARALSEGWNAKALKDLKEGAAKAGAYARADWLRAEAAAAKGRPGEALKALKKATKDRPYLARPHLGRARLEAALGKKAEARKSLKRALRLCPVFPEAEALLQSLAGSSKNA